MTPKVLIVAGLYDFSVDLVVAQLTERGVPFFRLNREELADHRLTLDPVAGILTIRFSGEEIRVTADSLCGIWYRQPVFLRNTPSDPLSISQQLERSQWAAFLRALMVFDSAGWMNNPRLTYAAECKPYQLMMAQRCGFQISTTIISNDAESVRRTFTDSIVVKSLDTVLLREGDECLFTYTTIATSELLTEENTSGAPLLAQRTLHDKTDIRVTVIGSSVFATRILSDGAGIEGDWRVVPRENLSYEDARLEEQAKASCVALTRKLGLAFAAIDLVENGDGIYFIEINPTGEWGWLNSPSRRIDIEIAKWLSTSEHQK